MDYFVAPLLVFAVSRIGICLAFRAYWYTNFRVWYFFAALLCDAVLLTRNVHDVLSAGK